MRCRNPAHQRLKCTELSRSGPKQLDEFLLLRHETGPYAPELPHRCVSRTATDVPFRTRRVGCGAVVLWRRSVRAEVARTAYSVTPTGDSAARSHALSMCPNRVGSGSAVRRTLGDP